MALPQTAASGHMQLRRRAMGQRAAAHQLDVQWGTPTSGFLRPLGGLGGWHCGLLGWRNKSRSTRAAPGRLGDCTSSQGGWRVLRNPRELLLIPPAVLRACGGDRSPRVAWVCAPPVHEREKGHGLNVFSPSNRSINCEDDVTQNIEWLMTEGRLTEYRKRRE